jgi:hypothetical protein
MDKFFIANVLDATPKNPKIIPKFFSHFFLVYDENKVHIKFFGLNF